LWSGKGQAAAIQGLVNIHLAWGEREKKRLGEAIFRGHLRTFPVKIKNQREKFFGVEYQKSNYHAEVGQVKKVNENFALQGGECRSSKKKKG